MCFKNFDFWVRTNSLCNPISRWYLVELSFWDAVPVEDDAVGLEACGLVELDEQLLDHGRQVLDDLLPVLLDTHCGRISARVGIHAANNLKHKKEHSLKWKLGKTQLYNVVDNESYCKHLERDTFQKIKCTPFDWWQILNNSLWSLFSRVLDRHMPLYIICC